MDREIQRKKSIFILLSLMFFAFSVMLWICFTEFTNFALFTIAIFCTLTFFICWLNSWALNKNYKIRYLIFKKSLNEQIKASLVKFNTTDAEFISHFKNHSKDFYKCHGKIFNFINVPIYEKFDEEKKLLVIGVFEELVSCIKEKSGLENFFIALDKFSISRKEKYLLLIHNLLSNELLYYFMQLYKLTMFTFHDNELCEQFTQLNEKNKQIVKNVYDPILYNFEQEISEIYEYLKKENKKA